MPAHSCTKTASPLPVMFRLRAGTRYLPEASVNRAAFIAPQRRGTPPGWLQRALVQPWGWIVYNGLVRWPWGEERGRPRAMPS